MKNSERATIVLVHGGQSNKSCWQPTIDAIHAMQPDAQVLAVDLPGHGDEPGDLAKLTIAQCVDSVTAQILAINPSRVLLVGHSMAGITIPGVATRLGAAMIQRMMFVACCVPAQGQSVLGTLHPPMSYIAAYMAKRKAIAAPLPPFVVRWTFANGMSRKQQQFAVEGQGSESTRVTMEAVDRSAFPKLAMSWVLTKRDRALSPKTQRRFIANLGGVDEVIELDTCHNAMISEPDRLARIILERC